jgi:glycine cleavage system P protein (glycine dehydrogenase)
MEEGRMDRNNNPLRNAPHTVEDLVGEWDRPYSREAACFPAGAFRVDKYWTPVNRVDNVFGDRNLVFSRHVRESCRVAAATHLIRI